MSDAESGAVTLADPDPGLDLVFGALADPTRRHVVRTLISEGSTSVPALSARLPITRQAVAKHLATLGEAGLIERAPSARGREVRYRLRAGALAPAATWLTDADRAWAARLDRLKEIVEDRRQAP
jgi:DNA-binding transcriptional ArsR family regulator